MERQTIDQEGARQGEVSAASMQVGDDTIAIQRIATMTVEKHEFFPWDTPANRKTQSVYTTVCVGLLFFGLAGFAAAMLLSRDAGMSGLANIIGALLMVVGLVVGVRAAMMAMKFRKKEPYYRLIIGTSDGRQIPLVDNNRDVLTKIRDVVRYKMDTEDTSVTGTFDLNLDLVNLKLPKGAAAEPAPARAPAPAPAPAAAPEAAPAPAADVKPAT
jgi:hypothetical protein